MCVTKKMKQEVILNQLCLRFLKWSIWLKKSSFYTMVHNVELISLSLSSCKYLQ